MGHNRGSPTTTLPCTACGYDIASVPAGAACPECGAPVFGFEAAEARALQIRGLTLILWGLPATLLACLLGYVVFILVGPGDGRIGPVSAPRAGLALSIVPAMTTLVGLWMAAGPSLRMTASRWLRRLTALTFVLVAALGAHRLIAHLNATTALGIRLTGAGGFSYVNGYISSAWVRSYGLGALAGVAPVLAAVWSAWLIRSSARVGLLPRSTRVTPAALAAAASALIAFALPVFIDWVSRKTVPALMPGGNALPQSAFGRGGQVTTAAPIPWHAMWINPDSALFVAVVGYTLVILLGLWLWLGTLRLRERLLRLEPRPLTSAS